MWSQAFAIGSALAEKFCFVTQVYRRINFEHTHSLLFPSLSHCCAKKEKDLSTKRQKVVFSILQLTFVFLCVCSPCSTTNLSCYCDGFNISRLLLRPSCCWLTCSYPDQTILLLNIDRFRSFCVLNLLIFSIFVSRKKIAATELTELCNRT